MALLLMVVVSSIYSRPPIPIDETRYLSVAWEMWQSNEFLVPHINGQPYSHKPPLLFWLIHLSWLLFGVGEWSARLVAPLFALGSTILSVNLARRLWPEDTDTGRAVPFIVMGTLIWTIFSSLTMFDTLLGFLSLLALICLLEAGKKKSLLPWAGLSAALGLGILAKGPVIFLYVLPALIAAPWWKQTILPWRSWYLHCLLSIGLGLGIALCWAIPAAIAGGEEYRQAILFSQTAGRVVQAFDHARPFYWYALLLPVLFFPWFFWPPVWRGWKEAVSDPSSRFCAVVVGGGLLLLSFVSGKQIHYMVPLYPIAALLLARRATALPQSGRYERWLLVSIYVVLALLLVIVPHISFTGGDSGILNDIPKWIPVIPLVAALFIVFFPSTTTLGTIKRVSISIVVLVVLFNLSAARLLHQTYDQSTVAEQVRELQEGGAEVAVYPAELASQFHFSGRLTSPLIPQQQALGKMALWSRSHPQGFCLIFTTSPYYTLLIGTGTAQRYSDGWLILRPARDFFTSYKTWASQALGIDLP